MTRHNRVVLYDVKLSRHLLLELLRQRRKMMLYHPTASVVRCPLGKLVKVYKGTSHRSALHLVVSEQPGEWCEVVLVLQHLSLIAASAPEVRDICAKF